MAKVCLGHHREASESEFCRAVVAELVLTFLFVFAGVGTAMAAGIPISLVLTPGKLLGGAGTIAGLAAVATAHALVVAAMVSAGLHISGGHINPAVTLSLAVGGNITLFRSLFFIIFQLIGSSLACYLLSYLTGGLAMPVHTLAAGMGSLQGVLMELVLTFSLLFTVYATIVDPRKRAKELGPVLVGLVVGANMLAGGAFSAASMNPARSFGPALVSLDWTDHWVYWVGPILGGILAGFVYDSFFLPRSDGHVPLPRDEC